MIPCAYTHIGFCVSNLARSRAFYEGVLGFEFVRELKNRGSDVQDRFLQLRDVDLHAVFLRKGGLTLELLSYASPPVQPAQRRAMNQPGFTHLSIQVEDLTQALDALRAADGTVLDDTRVGDSACFVLDPDSQRVELVSSAAARRSHH